jgi:dienelactone hydrolase
MAQHIINYSHQNKNFHGYLSYTSSSTKAPAVLVCHDWSGQNDFARKKADHLAELGYVGFAIDMYGEGVNGGNNEEKSALMTPLINDRVLLKNRLLAAFETVSSLEMVDSQQIAIIGFCFGGLCALDLARTGLFLKGAVSFHGSLLRPNIPIEPISSKILVLHGYADPMVPPSTVMSFADEMTQAKADWQIHMYGHVMHAFTNPLANDPNFGTVYEPLADRRSWLAMKNFLEEMF